jgi:3-oxoadipate enol-lactonase
VDLGERRAFYARGGVGEPLLLIMGMSGHHGMWGEPFRSLLERDFDVLAYDHRGIGESGWAEAPFTIAELAEDAARLMAAVGWDGAHVLGISMGGMVAQELALTHPELVRTLVLGCTYAGPNGGSLHAPGPLRLVEAISTRDAELALRTAFEVNLSQQHRDAAGDYEAFRQLSLSAKVPAAVVMMQLQAALVHDTTARLPNLRIPTLVVHGTADEMIVASNGEHIAGLIPDAKLELLDGVGHLFWLEQPQRSAELVHEHALGR